MSFENSRSSTSSILNSVGSDSEASYRVAEVEWIEEVDGLTQVIHDELSELGHHPQYFKHDSALPREVDVIFTWAPYGKLLPILQQLESIPKSRRPIAVHWNTEGIPDLRLPWRPMIALGAFRSWIGRVGNGDNSVIDAVARKVTSPWENRVLRYRYIGDYHYAYRKGLLHVFADSSAIYAQLHSQHGLPSVIAPWGATRRWYEDLGLERDIDVLWMGKRGTRRRSQILDRVREELKKHGVEIYVADNEEKPFIYGKERTRFLNRSKITLNITRTWYDDNFSRFAMAAPNKSLIVSESILPHCPQFEQGVHYVSAPVDRLANTILYSLRHDEERRQIVENAYRMVTTELTFKNSIKRIMNAVDRVNRSRPLID